MENKTLKETEILQLVRLAASKMGATTFRNNTGMLKNKDGAYVRYGLCEGSSDLIGWTSEGKFLALEIKRPNKHATPEQERFLKAVCKAGGIGAVVHSEEEAIAAIRGERTIYDSI